MEWLPRKLYTEEHDLFRQSLKEYVEKEIMPNHAQWEKDKMVSREAWKQFGEMGFLCMNAPQKYGGLAIDDWRYHVIIMEELSVAGATGPGLGFALHNDIVAPYILHYGSEAIKEKYVPGIISGDTILAIAMSEPGAGSDLQGMRTTAEDKGDHYLVNGSKTFITNGYLSDLVVVAVKTDPAKGAKGISLLLVERGMEGFSKGKPFEKAGMHAQDTCELFFDNVKVPKENLLGQPGKGFAYMMTELAQERLVVAIGGLYAAKGAVEATMRYVEERNAFGRKISDFQNTRFKMAELVTEVQMGEIFLDRLIELHMNKQLDSASASMAKFRMTDLQCDVIDECVQLHGGYGYMWEYSVARAWADARAQRIYAGTNEIMKLLIARKIFGR